MKRKFISANGELFSSVKKAKNEIKIIGKIEEIVGYDAGGDRRRTIYRDSYRSYFGKNHW